MLCARRKDILTSGKSLALLHHRAICRIAPGPCRQRAVRRDCRQNVFQQSKLRRLARREGSLARCRTAHVRCAWSRRYRRENRSGPQRDSGRRSP